MRHRLFAFTGGGGTFSEFMPYGVSSMLLGMSLMISPVSAFAETNSPTVGYQTHGGRTELRVMLQNYGEYGGYDEPRYDDAGNENPYYNPPRSWAYADLQNLNFTVPSSITFVVKADGTLVAPNDARIHNESAFAVNVSGIKVVGENNWNLVSDATKSDKFNAVNISVRSGDFTSSDTSLDLSNYLDHKDKLTPLGKWNVGGSRVGYREVSSRDGRLDWEIAHGEYDSTGSNIFVSDMNLYRKCRKTPCFS